MDEGSDRFKGGDHFRRQLGNGQVTGDAAPELQAFHDALFEAHGAEAYGSAEDWLPIKESGHRRRMEILDGLSIGEIETKVVVDFGTGPWGFACVFPKLRNARSCISIDVSSRALSLAQEKDSELLSKMRYLVSDGEQIPLEDDSVDIFWAGEAIEHVRHPDRFMQEIARVCRHDGMVILTTPNRDAIYYKAALEDYTIGPEHIALMSYDELHTCMSSFLSNVSIVGFETSLYPPLDGLIRSQAYLAQIQERAKAFPLTASGLVGWGQVDKARYESAKKVWHLDEVIWSSERCEGHEHGESLRLFEGVFGVNVDPSHSLRISARCTDLVFLFWAHDWSGIASIKVDGKEHRVDLFSPVGGFRRVKIGSLNPGVHTVEIGRTGERRQPSHFDQVVFYKLLAYTVSA